MAEKCGKAVAAGGQKVCKTITQAGKMGQNFPKSGSEFFYKWVILIQQINKRQGNGLFVVMGSALNNLNMLFSSSFHYSIYNAVVSVNSSAPVTGQIVF